MNKNQPARRRPDGKHSRLLRQLAEIYNIQSAYTNVSGKRERASEESLLLVLKALGAHLEHFRDIPDALRQAVSTHWKRPISPVTVAWNGKRPRVRLRVSAKQEREKVLCRLHMENGDQVKVDVDLRDLADLESADVDGTTFFLKEWKLDRDLPHGYHRLILEGLSGALETLIIAAPLKTYAGEGNTRLWGVFSPIYALHSQKSWGAGDFTDVEDLQDWIAQMGGQLVATLPFMAAFHGEPFEPGPYSPASRLFLNEFFLDLNRAAEISADSEARKMLDRRNFPEVGALRAATLVDYRRVMALKRQVLEMLSNSFFRRTPDGSIPFQSFRHSLGAVDEYAAFMAVCEHTGKAWTEWPFPLRDGRISPGDYQKEVKQYHLFVQWLAYEQIKALDEKARKTGPGLYVDLPLGVHPSSFDIWKWRELFPKSVSAGAPPDAVFTKGQDWGFAPLHPLGIRENRYEYVIEYLSRIMRNAGLLRLDHVMGLHRIYWIPQELQADQGVFVRYPAEELYAILSLESHRNRCMLVGENLGTVPGYVNKAMERHSVHQMYVVQYELDAQDKAVLKPPPPNSVASLNTHDMSPFGGYLHGQDISDRRQAGMIKDADEANERQKRSTILAGLKDFLRKKDYLGSSENDASILEAALSFLGASRARVVLLTLEDLWLERQAQNLPGTTNERPNWRRKLRYSLEQMQNSPEITDILKKLNRLRRDRNIGQNTRTADT